jgi:DNA-directed RNA polymerase subunit RPC12/RpoP
VRGFSSLALRAYETTDAIRLHHRENVSMPIEFHCAGCQKQLRVQDDAAGKRARCPQCGAIVEVPSAKSADLFDFSAEPSPAVAAPPSYSDNPFDAPQTANIGGAVYGQAPRSGVVTAVAVVNYVVAGLQLMCGLAFMAFGLLGARMLRNAAAQNPNVQINGVNVGLIVVIVGVVWLALAVPMLLAGYGVQKRRNWGRVLSLILAGLAALGGVFQLLALNPAVLFSAGYAIFLFVVLLNEKYAAEFA